MSATKLYEQELKEAKTISLQIQKKHVVLGVSRLILILLFVYFSYYFLANKAFWAMGVAIGALAVFIFLKIKHDEVAKAKKFYDNLQLVNQNELDYLLKNQYPYGNGKDFYDPKHMYANDLDVLGENSLFHLLNRCTTFIGKQKLASALLNVSNKKSIEEIQEAVKELKNAHPHTKNITAHGIAIENESEKYTYLKKWAEQNPIQLPSIRKKIAIASPIILLLLIVASFVLENPWWGRSAFLLFMFHLSFLVAHLKFITGDLGKNEKVNDSILQYNNMIKSIEACDFKSAVLVEIKEDIFKQNTHQKIKELAKLFQKIDSIQNLVAAILFNGFSLYHLKAFIQLQEWKVANSNCIHDFLEHIGELEKLISLATFYRNHSETNFPEISENMEQVWDAIVHPLLLNKKNVANSINFKPQNTVILTGANMSGKSTFLRAIGANNILANAGAPVCAQKAVITPLPLLVSMRLSDDINEETSYFYAEILKLKKIVTELNKGPALLLLDEILRGTNSDDKQEGTKSFIKTIIQHQQFGIIATHDLEVCTLANEYPENISNYCFESEMKNDNLFFDYQLRPGICKNKNAMFLLKQNQII